ncbi:MAG: hypothetical protein ACI4RV_04630, partial [Eubacteriales bacterium]
MQSISKAIYLIDDNEHPYYGYEFDDRGLVQAERGYYPCFTFTKVYAEYEALLKRKFRKVQEGSLTLEVNFVIDCDNGFSVKLYNEDKSACIGVITENAGFTVWGEAVTPVPVLKNEKNSFKLTVDFEKRVYDVILNNRFCARFVLPDEIDNLNHISLGIEKGYTGKVDAKGVKLYAGYLVNEKFLAPFEGSVPSDLNFSGGTARVVREDNCTFSLEDIYHLAMDAEKEDCVLSKRIGIGCARLCYEIRFIDRTGSADAFFGLDECGFACRIGTVSYRDHVVCDYPVNIWNTLRFELFDGKLALRLNGRDICELDCEKKDFERYVVKVAKGTRLEVDDLSLFPLAELPADYVEKPKPAKTKGYHVGVNVCSLWRNGFWRGRHDASWDVCTPFDELTPYLGYYDEGIPEVADWETKWF